MSMNGSEFEAPTWQVALTYGAAGDGEFVEFPPDPRSLLERMHVIGEKYRQKLGIAYSVDLIAVKKHWEQDPSKHRRLSVGIGNDQWVIFFFPGEEEGRNLCSLGDTAATGTLPFWFGDWNDIPCRHLIPRELAQDAVDLWFKCGALSSAISWTDDMVS